MEPKALLTLTLTVVLTIAAIMVLSSGQTASQDRTGLTDATQLDSAPSFVTAHTKIYQGQLYSDSNCKTPVSVDVNAFTHGGINVSTTKVG